MEGILSFADSTVRSKFDSAAVNAVLDANEAMMKFACTVRSICISVGFLLFSSLVSASDELIVYVFDNGVPVANASVVVDGETLGTTRGDSQGEVGNALYLNNWVYDCANASDAQGLLVQADFDASAGTINAVAAEGNLGQFYESLSAEASGLDALDWTAINGSLPESVADVEYLDSTDFAGAVNPDQSDLWWAGWTISGSL